MSIRVRQNTENKCVNPNKYHKSHDQNDHGFYFMSIGILPAELLSNIISHPGNLHSKRIGKLSIQQLLCLMEITLIYCCHLFPLIHTLFFVKINGFNNPHKFPAVPTADSLLILAFSLLYIDEPQNLQKVKLLYKLFRFLLTKHQPHRQFYMIHRHIHQRILLIHRTECIIFLLAIRY